jgi:hypothetical protein
MYGSTQEIAGHHPDRPEENQCSGKYAYHFEFLSVGPECAAD